MIIRYFEERTVCKQTTKSIKRSLLSFVCCIFMMLGGLLTSSEAYSLTCPTLSKGDLVVMQNVGEKHEERSGLNVRKHPNTNRGNDPEAKVYDGTEGIILSDSPVSGSGYLWYEVKWDTLPVIKGWSVGIYAGTKVIATISEARQKDELVEALFKLNSGSADAHTRHDYNDYECTWPGHPYDGGHSGWDVVIDSDDPVFHALIGGELIQDGEDENNTIAVYNADHEITVLYLHADSVKVSMAKPTITKDQELGTQGSTGPNVTGAHVHIEVRKGRRKAPSAGADASQKTEWPNMDPIPKLYEVRKSYEEDQPPVGGGPGLSRSDVNNDDRIDILDLILVWANIGQDVQDFPQFDVNHDEVIDKEDIVEVAKNLDDPEDAAAPANFVHNQLGGITIRAGQAYIGDKTVSQETLQQLLNTVRQANSGSLTFKRSIAMLESILAAMAPHKTALLANYPNPFNPETWIPYQLAEPADVTLTIYSVEGKLVRSLGLGHQPIGIYQNRSRAAYWDGRNTVGEPVASGVYFYTLTAGEFTATRKMLIRK